MQLSKIQTLLKAESYTKVCDTTEVAYAFGSDLMSDVLTIEENIPLLITGLANTQSIRTAEMADINIVIIARGKEITQEMKNLAIENDIMLFSTPYSLFRVCGLLFQNGIKPLY